MRTRVLLAGLALGATAASGLTACGSGNDSSGGSSSSSSGNSTDDYCKELKADKAFFESFDDGDVDKLDEAFGKFHELADDAPKEVAADWKVLDSAITTVETTLKDAGLSTKDLSALQDGKVPAGVNPQKLQEIGPKLQALGDEKFSKAGDAIEAHAKKACNLDLS